MVDRYFKAGKSIEKGEYLTLTMAGRDHFGLPIGQPMQVVSIRVNDDGGSARIYLYSEDFFEELGNPDGFFDEDGHGVRVSDKRLFLYFEKEERKEQCEVAEDYSFKSHNLKGMKGVLIARRGEISFVELENDVGGSSCDGEGKSGHCVIVPSKIVRTGAQPRKTKKSV